MTPAWTYRIVVTDTYAPADRFYGVHRVRLAPDGTIAEWHTRPLRLTVLGSETPDGLRAKLAHILDTISDPAVPILSRRYLMDEVPVCQPHE